jgi:hypothetical protein
MTSNETHPPFVVTLKLDAHSFGVFEALRRAHFPPERNFLPAHITLFHALPGEQEAEVRQTLQQTAERTSIFSLSFPALRFLGRGVAMDVISPELLQLRAALATTWQTFLNPQDRQKYQPHITIQNKVPAETARVLYQRLSAEWTARAGQGQGLLLWRYLGGPWALVSEFPFCDRAASRFNP